MKTRPPRARIPRGRRAAPPPEVKQVSEAKSPPPAEAAEADKLPDDIRLMLEAAYT
jgi:hypothetical protein